MSRCPTPAGRSTTGSLTPSTTTSTCRRRSSSSGRRCARDLPIDERRWLALDADQVLGLDLDRVWDADTAEAEEAPTEVLALVEERAAARAARDFARADALRAEIEAAGWEIEDSAGGSTVRRRAWWPRPTSS